MFQRHAILNIFQRSRRVEKYLTLGLWEKAGLDATKGFKLLAALPLAKWIMRSRSRLDGKAVNLVSAVAIHAHTGKTDVADYSCKV